MGSDRRKEAWHEDFGRDAFKVHLRELRCLESGDCKQGYVTRWQNLDYDSVGAYRKKYQCPAFGYMQWLDEMIDGRET